MRDQYLTSEWQPYPAAPQGCQSLHQFLKDPKAKTWVGGRILWSDPANFDQGHFLLSAFDQIVLCEWRKPFKLVGQKNTQQTNQQHTPKTNYTKELIKESLSQFFKYGDQIAVYVDEVTKEKAEFDEDEDEIKLKVTEILFLAPAINEPKLKNFSTKINWQNFIKRTKEFFTNQGLQEITTSTLVQCPGLEDRNF